MKLEVGTQSFLEVKIPEFGGLEVREQIEEEIIDEQEAVDLGLYERTDGTRIAAGPTWEILIEPLQYVLREGQHYSYYTKFENLLNKLLEQRIKFYLSQERIMKIDIALQEAQQDIHNTLENISKVMRFLNKKYSINDSTLL